jgi:DNA-binding winged helix-turn-helix (wHTH) protein
MKEPVAMISFSFGQSLYHQGEFLKALEALEPFCNSANKFSAEYTDALFYRLRIYTELERNEQRLELEHELRENLPVLTEKGHALFNYVQGYNYFLNRDFKKAEEHLETALQYALECSCRFTLAQALFGCIFTSVVLNKDVALIDANLAKLEILTEELGRADLRVSVLSLKADVALHKKEYSKAIEYVWQAYDQVKLVKNNFLSVSIFGAIGHVYLTAGDIKNAGIYINLAHRSVDPENYKQLSKRIAAIRSQINTVDHSEFDLILDEHKNILIEKFKGVVELKNQFILVDLLKLFMQNPGLSFSKEELAKRLWNQEYSPALHDNVIYVTIKRIRSLIEPNPNQSKYILRSRKGYLLNEDSKILIHNKEASL